MSLIVRAAPVLAAMLLFSVQTLAQTPSAVSIVVDGESELDVFYSRAMSNATGAVIAGVIGAGIQSGIEAGRDGDLLEELAPRVDVDHWRAGFLEVINERLGQHGFDANWADEPGEADTDLVLELELDTHGFRIVDTNTRLMSGFIEFEYRLYPAGTSRRDRPEFRQVYVTSQAQRTREQLIEDDQILNEDLGEALNKAARRMANRIIYWRP